MTSRDDKIITVLGAGYVGLSTAAILANAGNIVHLVEPDESRLNVIKQGQSFFYEKGLDNLISKALKNKTLLPTNNYADSVAKSSIIFSCVGTPDNPDGSSDLTYIFQSATETIKHLSNPAIFVQKSTVPVGTSKKIKELFSGHSVSYVSNPEFLREGTAIYDSLFFDRIVIGGDNISSIEVVENLYRELECMRFDIAHLAQIDIPETDKNSQYIRTDLSSAELIKVTSNAFLALKISFANSIAMLSDKAGSDIISIMDAVGADQRIGRQFLNAGRGYGGGCFPKDVDGLISSAKDLGVDLSIMQAVQDVNNSMVPYVIKKMLQAIDKENFDGMSVAVLGTAFKSGTSDTRRSPGIKFIELLLEDGALVKAYDPEAISETGKHFGLSPNNLIFAPSVDEALLDADIVILATDWRDFIDLDLAFYKVKMRGTLFVDAINSFNPSSVRNAGLSYVGVGRS